MSETIYPTNDELIRDLKVMLGRIKKKAWREGWAAKEIALSERALKSGRRVDLKRAILAWGDRPGLPCDEAIVEMALHGAELKGYICRIREPARA